MCECMNMFVYVYRRIMDTPVGKIVILKFKVKEVSLNGYGDSSPIVIIHGASFRPEIIIIVCLA